MSYRTRILELHEIIRTEPGVIEGLERWVETCEMCEENQWDIKQARIDLDLARLDAEGVDEANARLEELSTSARSLPRHVLDADALRAVRSAVERLVGRYEERILDYRSAAHSRPATSVEEPSTPDSLSPAGAALFWAYEQHRGDQEPSGEVDEVLRAKASMMSDEVDEILRAEASEVREEVIRAMVREWLQWSRKWNEWDPADPDTDVIFLLAEPSDLARCLDKIANTPVDAPVDAFLFLI